MQNILINMGEKFHYDRLRNDRALGNQRSDNNVFMGHSVLILQFPVLHFLVLHFPVLHF